MAKVGSVRGSGGAITRRSLFAAASVLATAVGAKVAHAKQGYGYGHDQPGEGHCYLGGTRILTPDGPRDIASLRVGDLVVSLSGAARPIKRIGRNRFVRGSNETWPERVRPVKVARFALDGRVPIADLFLSGEHALYLDGMLIAVRSLINGRTIVRDAATDKEVLEYFHVELPTHDVIFAEGAPAETFLPSADGIFFDESSEPAELDGVDDRGVPTPFAPEIRMRSRAEIRSRLRSAISPWVDRRRPFDRVRDRLEDYAIGINGI